MSERGARRRGDSEMEEHVQALLSTAYPRASEPAKPSDGLRRRVAEMGERHDMRPSRATPGGVFWPALAWLRPRMTPMAELTPRRVAWPLAAGLLVTAGSLIVLQSVRGSRVDKPVGLAAAHPQAAPAAAGPRGSGKHVSRTAPNVRLAGQPATSDSTSEPGAPGPAAAAHASVRHRAAPAVWPATQRRPGRTTSDDLSSLNGDVAAVPRRWATLPASRWDAIEAQVYETAPVRDDFVQVPFPRLASASDRQIVAAVESYKREAAVVDPRLSHEVTLQQKSTALADLCERLRADTGVAVVAGRSVADEKVSLFCRKMPLRDVMRQLSRPFGYTWLRSGKTGEYKYELVQDLRSQLLEEDLRQRDRNAAMLALDREMSQYHRYLSLSPEQARAAAPRASALEKPSLQKLAGPAWGPIEMYFRLSRGDLAALRSGQRLTFSTEPKAGEQVLPPEVARGAIQSLGHAQEDEGEGARRPEGPAPGGGAAPAAEPRPEVALWIVQSELGRFTLTGTTAVAIESSEGMMRRVSRDDIAVGESPSVMRPDNRAANATLARDPALRPRVTVRPQPSCVSDSSSSKRGGGSPEAKVTPADVLQALHRASGAPIVADSYTRLYPVASVSVQNTPLFDALNRIADTMRLRWNKEGAWVQLRSTSYYDDRLKEVPNRLLTHWAAARRQHGSLTLDDLVEIAQLTDAQLDAASMAEGARACFGLSEWNLGRNRELRPHLRYLATLTDAQRQEVQSAKGLPFTRMSLAQQQQFIALAFGPQADRLQSLEELTGAAVRVDYSLPGMFEWRSPEQSARLDAPTTRGAPPGARPGPGAEVRANIAIRTRPGGGPPAAPIRISPVRERTREAALEAARRIDSRADGSQIVPSEVAVTVMYTLSGPNAGGMPLALRVTADGTQMSTIGIPPGGRP